MQSLPRRVSFGVFAMDLTTGELRKKGRRIQVQQQPFLVLAMLVERAGEVVSREELQKAVWPADTLVDSDYGLNTAIKKIRIALGDSADQPRFVETLPRKGYRFISSVTWEVLPQPASLSEAQSSSISPPPSSLPADAKAGYVRTLRLQGWSLGAIVLTALTIAVAFWWHIPRRSELLNVPVPLTSYQGQEQQPSFSPDARNIAFVWNGGEGQNLDIYTRPLSGGNPVRITRDAAMDVSPVWSPDGGRIAFARITGENNGGVFVVPSSGGPEVRVSSLRKPNGLARSWVLLPSWIAWTPDGNSLVLSDLDESQDRFSMFLVPLGGGVHRRLTTPDAGWSDSAPAFSPDHRSLAFVRSLSVLDADVFVLPLNDHIAATAAPRRISSLHRMTPGLTWARDGREVIFASGQPGASKLWRISVVDGTPARPLPFGPENALWPTISSQGHLAYEVSQSDTNIWRVSLKKTGEPRRWIASTRDDSDAKYSPDGRRILFLSKRGGNNEIWIANADGNSTWQLTNLHTSFIGWPNWSPDGSTIVFDSPRDGPFDVYSISAAGGSVRKLTDHNVRKLVGERVPCGAASYSRDGKWIYFNCIEGGVRQMWWISVRGGLPKRIRPGLAQLESPDRRYLYFVEFMSGISRPLWRMPVEGGDPTRILPDVEPFNYAPTLEGIHFSSTPDDNGRCFIRFLHLAGGSVSTTLTYIGRPAAGLSISPDGQWLLYSYDEARSSDLMLVEDFH